MYLQSVCSLMLAIAHIFLRFWVLQVAGSNPAAPTKEIKDLAGI
jgi:hypothetical protein